MRCPGTIGCVVVVQFIAVCVRERVRARILWTNSEYVEAPAELFAGLHTDQIFTERLCVEAFMGFYHWCVCLD